MKIDYFTAGIDSLETSLEQLKINDDRHLRAAILLGHHGVTCLLKAAVLNHEMTVSRGSKSIPFPGLTGILKRLGWVDSTECKALHLLNELRNDLEHQEVDYDKNKFETSLHEVLPIVERITRECNQTDLQDELSEESWDVLMEIEEFFSHREEALDDIVESMLPRGKDSGMAEAIHCGWCGHDGLPWEGFGREEVACKFCGETSIVESCDICAGGIAINKEDGWPYIMMFVGKMSFLETRNGVRTCS